MAVINRFAEFHDEIADWRRHIHRNPELSFDVHGTAAFVADKLRSFGVDEVVTGVGRSGVVGVIRGGRAGGRTVGLRADMDALPIAEETGRPWASQTPGRMHACGHDGHTAMLLGAARYLAETRSFAGTAVVVFQPAEEDGGGGKVMVDDGLMERFRIDEIYGMHNRPGLAVGRFATRAGAVMAAADEFEIRLDGRGGHAARPHQCVDLVVTGAAIVQALQSIVARNVDPARCAVVSVTQFHAGQVSNVIAQRASLAGTARTLDEATRDLIERRIGEIAGAVAAAHGATAETVYQRLYPVTVNDAAAAAFAVEVASGLAGPAQVDGEVAPVMGAEDFSFMLNVRPGAMIFIGNGNSAGLHHPEFDFNDDIIPLGCSYWARLVETRLA